MPKVTNLRNLVKAAIGALTVLPVCASCVYDSYMDAPDDNATMVNVGLTLRTGDVTGDVEGFVQGSDYENYIDIEGGDYRIYFFTNSVSGGNDTFLARFEPSSVVANTDYTEYTLYGTVPDGVVSEEGDTSFKIMVLANWGTYPDDDDLVGAGIDNVCTASTATFSAFVDGSDNALMPSATQRIPFYGIHAYSDISLEAGKTVRLEEPITLLRAMAKVEVILESTDVSFSSVKVQRYNSMGYCAPDGVYSQSNYGQGTDWSTDYLTGVHLVNGYNDDNGTPTERSISFYDTNNDGRTWVAYLPEYKNTATDDDYSYIKVTVDESGDTHEIYFANYTDGKTDNAMENRFDIQRNNLYHYEVEVSATGTRAANKKLSMTEWNIFMRR